MYRAITSDAEINHANRALWSEMTRQLAGTSAEVGHRGATELPLVYRLAESDCWFSISKTVAPEGRYWFPIGFGTGAPLPITVEINVPLTDGQGAGIFARNALGELFLFHSGRVGGGRPGIGKSSFCSYLDLSWFQPVAWPGRNAHKPKVVSAILVGRVDRAIRNCVVELARHVAAYKAEVTTPSKRGTRDPEMKYAQEFCGQPRPYLAHGLRRPDRSHGLVIAALKSELDALCPDCVVNDRFRDLFVFDRESKRTRILIEAKTAADSQSVYTGIGQLMFHSALDKPGVCRILVLPTKPDRKVQERLDKLGILLVTYTIANRKVKLGSLSPLRAALSCS